MSTQPHTHPTLQTVAAPGPASTRLVAADALVVVLLGVLAASPFHDAYGGWRWLVVVVTGLAVGLGVAWASARWRWGPWGVASTLVLAHLTLGTAVALPELAVAAVLPDLDALRTLLTGGVDAWRDQLTLAAPLGSDGTVLLVPWLTALLVGVIAGVGLWRRGGPGLAVLALALLLVAAVAFGDRATSLTAPRGALLTVLVLAWVRIRADRTSRVNWARRVGALVTVAAVVGAGGTVVAGALESDEREVLRDHVEPPFDPLDQASPLSRFRVYEDDKGLRDSVLFTVEGLEGGELVRLATMDTYDGVVWNVAGGESAATQSGSFGRFTSQTEGRDTRRVSVTVVDQTGPWVPSYGQVVDVRVSGGGFDERVSRAGLLYNRGTGTVAQAGGLRKGTTYSYDTIPGPTAAEPGSATALWEGEMPAEVSALTKKVRGWTQTGGNSGGTAAVDALVEQFRLGYHSDGQPGQTSSAAGHGLHRLNVLAGAEQMVGNDEQYAAAMAVAAQQQGIAARVVLGFEVPDEVSAGGSREVHGGDVAAWVEVEVPGAGWVPFRPTPDEDRVLTEKQQEPEPEPQPYVVQPPVVPDEPGDLSDKVPQGAGDVAEKDVAEIVGEVVRWIGYVLGAGLLLLPLWLPALLKRRRSRRRRFAGGPVDRVSGGWRELTDRARDLGVRLPPGGTRRENAVQLDQRWPDGGITLLAERADSHVFGFGEPDDESVRVYWADVDTALGRIRGVTPWWWRPLAAVSLASFGWRRALRRWLTMAGAPAADAGRRLRGRTGSVFAVATTSARRRRSGQPAQTSDVTPALTEEKP